MMAPPVPEIQRILYATDLSEHARHAFDYAVMLAHRFGAEIIVLHVLEDPSPFAWSLVEETLGSERFLEIKALRKTRAATLIRERLQRLCEEAKDRYRDCPFVVKEIFVKTGHPVDQILRLAEEKDADLIVMGSRGQSVLADITMGSTSRRVLRRCKRPVLIVRLPEAGE